MGIYAVVATILGGPEDGQTLVVDAPNGVPRRYLEAILPPQNGFYPPDADSTAEYAPTKVVLEYQCRKGQHVYVWPY